MIELIAIGAILALDFGILALAFYLDHRDHRPQPVHHRGARRLP